MASVPDRVQHRLSNSDGRRLAIAIGAALPPSLMAYLLISLAVATSQVWTFWLALVGFTYLFSQQPGLRAQGASMLFLLAVETFLLPLAMVGYLVSAIGQTETATIYVGTVIDGVIFFAAVWLLSWSAGIALYLVSQRFEPSSE